jgi:hypothetical protein
LKPKNVQLASLEEACRKYAEQLGPDATAWLEKRGIPQDVATARLLGSVTDPIMGHELFKGRLSIPYMTRAGLVWVQFRCQEHENCDEAGCSKYLPVEGTESRLYNVAAFQEDSSFIAITEGALDAVVLHYLCGIPAVGVPGVSHWKEHFPRCFTGYERVLIYADNDLKANGKNPGLEMARRIKKDLRQAEIVMLPPGMDVTDTYLAEGEDGLRKRAGL